MIGNFLPFLETDIRSSQNLSKNKEHIGLAFFDPVQILAG
jgi:hypothetical protein